VQSFVTFYDDIVVVLAVMFLKFTISRMTPCRGNACITTGPKGYIALDFHLVFVMRQSVNRNSNTDDGNYIVTLPVASTSPICGGRVSLISPCCSNDVTSRVRSWRTVRVRVQQRYWN
jgi:hypothetical protein